MRHALALRNELVGNVSDAQTRIMLADQSMTGTTPVALTELFFYAAPRELWTMSGVMFATSASSSPDVVWSFTVPTGAFHQMSSHSIWSANNEWTTGTFSGLVAGNDPAGSLAILFAIVRMGAVGGRVQINFRQANNNGTAITVKKLSSLTARRMASE